MPQRSARFSDGAIIGVSDHWGWAVLVTVTRDGTVLDRRRVVLVDSRLPKHPHHHEAQSLPLEQAERLVERVRVSAERHAGQGFEAVAAAVRLPVLGVAMRMCPPLPPTLAERLRDYRAQNVADSVLYRTALARVAERRGWAVHWYDAKKVLHKASEALDVADLNAHFAEVKKALGSPWGQDHRTAMAAAIVAAARDHGP
jgi:hypothetical protein